MIRYLDHKDKDKWKKLYNAYADFYNVPMNSPILDTLWNWILDDNHIVNGICYELEGNIVGIAHYRSMPRPKFRGQQITQKLISYLKSLSKANNWNRIRWITPSFNENAKKLYDKISNNTGFELYEFKGD